MTAQYLLSLHREQIAIEHRRGLHEILAEREHRNFERQPAGLQHAPLHILRQHLEVQVTGIDLRPRIEDRNYRLSLPILRSEPHLPRPRPMSETAHIVGTEPAVAAELFGGEAFVR